jgi:hypothetical protein
MDAKPSAMDRTGLVPASERCVVLAIPGKTFQMDAGAWESSEIHVVTMPAPEMKGIPKMQLQYLQSLCCLNHYIYIVDFPFLGWGAWHLVFHKTYLISILQKLLQVEYSMSL